MAGFEERGRSDELEERDSFLIGEAILLRVRSVAQRIAERVRKLTGDIDLEEKASDETDPGSLLGASTGKRSVGEARDHDA